MHVFLALLADAVTVNVEVTRAATEAPLPITGGAVPALPAAVVAATLGTRAVARRIGGRSHRRLSRSDR